MWGHPEATWELGTPPERFRGTSSSSQPHADEVEEG
eukprot:CAMPEP_0119340524 /NCGR_PEP_ID=MMETSP1333-20130426/100559_1 /TAXON_ID=418940 /ORGANISM="Scyphosphaera apsteinii, Strain RCC1455" /LENGTH=35 /DNA_ID= /DNA_START= /DNA_END= /DNA_ORIENTATION=